MPSFSGGPNYRTPFGKKVYLRSTQDVKTISKTFAASTCPTETVDGESVKVLQPGSIIAKITSGAESGKVGPFTLEVANADGRKTTSNIVGINDTFLPWQLLYRDVEIAVVYEASVVQAQLRELDAAGAWATVSAGTVTAIKALDNCKFIFF